MKQQKGSTQARTIWRMSEAAPQGEFIAVADVGTAKAAAARATAAAQAAAAAATAAGEAPKREISHGSWLESSFELLHGTEIHEGPDTVPDDLFDQLFAPPQTNPDKSGS